MARMFHAEVEWSLPTDCLSDDATVCPYRILPVHFGTRVPRSLLNSLPVRLAAASEQEMHCSALRPRVACHPSEEVGVAPTQASDCLHEASEGDEEYAGEPAEQRRRYAPCVHWVTRSYAHSRCGQEEPLLL